MGCFPSNPFISLFKLPYFIFFFETSIWFSHLIPFLLLRCRFWNASYQNISFTVSSHYPRCRLTHSPVICCIKINLHNLVRFTSLLMHFSVSVSPDCP
ncbi:hypothetical protein V6Z12_A09G016500 [Gossypium hirsutum]